MVRRLRVLCRGGAFALLVVGGVLGATAVAHADAVTPAGSCVGGGEWEEAGLTETSTEHDPGDLIEIPQADTVFWEGALPELGGGSLGSVNVGEVVDPARPISGEVQLETPIGWATIDSWGNDSHRAGNVGEHDYDAPDVLIGIEMKLRGRHFEKGALYCSGHVRLKIDGTNPLAVPSYAGLAISGGILLYAGRPVVTKLWSA